jgi:hypothetical protein
VPERLTVHLNREGLRDVAPEATALETDRSFALVFENHGGPVHVHVKPDESLESVATPSESQVYVDEGETRNLEVTVPDGGAGEGELSLSTGYGAEERTIDVTISDRRKDGGPTVAVDNSLSEKQQVETETTQPAGDGLREFVLAGVGVVVAAAIALAVSDSAAIFVGVLALLGGVATAIYMLR